MTGSAAALLELCEAIRVCDDRIGRYSDHEGNEEGPTYWAYHEGYKPFRRYCLRALEDHKAAVAAFAKLLEFNETQKRSRR